MTTHEYVAADGGPHLVLPAEFAGDWKGGGLSGLAADYMRAVSASSGAKFGFITVGKGTAMSLRDPPLSSWGRSPEGWIDIYVLQQVKDSNADDLVDRAAATATITMSSTGKSITISSPDLFLLFAGDTTTSFAYPVHRIPLAPGAYIVLQGRYVVLGKEEVDIYRLQPRP